jgi:hypothetical protein
LTLEFEYLSQKIGYTNHDDFDFATNIDEKIMFLTQMCPTFKKQVKKKLLLLGLKGIDGHAVRFHVTFCLSSEWNLDNGSRQSSTSSVRAKLEVSVSVEYAIMSLPSPSSPTGKEFQSKAKRGISQYLLDEFLIDTVRAGDRTETKFLLKLGAKISDKTLDIALLSKEYDPIIHADHPLNKHEICRFELEKNDRMKIYKLLHSATIRERSTTDREHSAIDREHSATDREH